MRPSLNSRHSYLAIFALFVLLGFQNCFNLSVFKYQTTDTSKILESQGTANGDGYLGKPGDGTYVRTLLNFKCIGANTIENSVQGFIEIKSGSTSLIEDNCQNFSYPFISKEVEYFDYNPDFVGINSGIYESSKTFNSEVSGTTESFCRSIEGDKAIDVVTKVSASGESKAKIYLGDLQNNRWLSRAVPYFTVSRQSNAAQSSYQSGAFKLSVDRSSANLLQYPGQLSANIDGVQINKSVICRHMRSDSVLFNPNQGMIALWQLNNSYNDLSGLAHHINVTDPTNSLGFATGRYASAVTLNGDTNARLQVNPTAALNNLPQMTLAAWIRPTDIAGNAVGGIIEKSVGVANPTAGWTFFVGAQTTRLGFVVSYSGMDLVYTTASNVIATNNWNHVVLTWDGGNLISGVKLYVNGVLAPIGYVADGVGTRIDDSAIPVVIGDMGDDVALSSHFNGSIDHASIWNRALTPQQVSNLYNTGNPQ